ncbi:MAG: cation:proton antiporter [Rhabdochlamydiaceae bacterium]|nr:cation:proton antiporter [Rhabdochlamydiaceae bacterium]
MEAYTFFLQLLLVVFSARVLGELAARFQVPAVLGEMLAGVLIGPSLLGWIAPSDQLALLSEVGVVLLLFEVGMETDISKLQAAGKKALLVAFLGVILPFTFGFTLSFYTFHFSFLISFFIASALTTTSIGITSRVFKDYKQQNSPASHIVTGAAILGDIIAILLLSLVYEFITVGSVSLWNTGKLLLSIFLFLILSPFAARGASYVIKKWEEKSDIPGLLTTTIISLIFFFAYIAHILGAPALLGGFAAGVALSKRFFFPFKGSQELSHRVETSMKPIVHLFSPIFFVSIGLSLDLKRIFENSSLFWILTLVLSLAAIAGKLLSGLVLIKDSHRTRWTVGCAMIPRGEVGLIFASVGLSIQVLSQELYTILILLIAITTLLPPLFLRFLFKKKSFLF